MNQHNKFNGKENSIKSARLIAHETPSEFQIRQDFKNSYPFLSSCRNQIIWSKLQTGLT